MITCGHCGVSFPRTRKAGKPRVYCDGMCERKALGARRTFALAFLKWAERSRPRTVITVRAQLGFS